MQQIKFVLWERYRAWWGAHQLNEKNPILVDHLKDEEKANKLGMTIRQYRQRRAIMEKTAKKNKETAKKNKETARLREIRRAAAHTLDNEKAARKVEEDAARKVEERQAQLERNVEGKEERKDAAMMDMYQKLAGGGPEIASLEKSVDPMKEQAEAEDVKSEGDKGGETVKQSGDGQEKPDDTPKQ
jgi:hypothetical protein